MVFVVIIGKWEVETENLPCMVQGTSDQPPTDFFLVGIETSPPSGHLGSLTKECALGRELFCLRNPA